ncbi:hypothetical protein [Methylobacterium sp. SI9]|uniref:hypothetical protein n=1 Tax=Methylobacterium guangdongense TaxID=3138811 RepID=UPI00313BF178
MVDILDEEDRPPRVFDRHRIGEEADARIRQAMPPRSGLRLHVPEIGPRNGPPADPPVREPEEPRIHVLGNELPQSFHHRMSRTR